MVVPVVETQHSPTMTWVQSLVGELGSLRPGGIMKKRKTSAREREREGFRYSFIITAFFLLEYLASLLGIHVKLYRDSDSLG